MIRVALLFLLLFQTINAAEVIFRKDVDLPEPLKKRVAEYWEKRGGKLFEETYSYELPYLQYLHTPFWYEKFFQNAPKFSKIEVKKVTECNEKRCVIGLLLRFKFSPNSTTFLYDKWINLDGVWYHKYNDNPLPTF